MMADNQAQLKGMEYTADLVRRHFAPAARVNDADRVAAVT
jgi:hypothetical protein